MPSLALIPKLRAKLFAKLSGSLLLCTVLLTGCGDKSQHWSLTDVQGHLPDLQFSLTSDLGRPVSAGDYRGKVVLVYFGYTHCPDVCPATMARLGAATQQLGASADHVRILFISVDPARDTPALLHAYVTAFDRHAVGLTGTPAQIEDLAKRYRVAYQPAASVPSGNYEVSHSPAVYIFDQDGHARLLAAPSASVEAIVHDVRQLVQSAS